MPQNPFRAKKGLVVNGVSGDVTVHIYANDAMLLPAGTTAQRPAGANGYFRYNTDDDKFEGFANGAWGSVGGGGGYYKGDAGVAGDPANIINIFRINANSLNTDTVVAAGENAQATGPLVIANGVTLTVDTGGRVAII